MTNYPHKALSAATHCEKPAVKVECGSAQKFHGNESLKNSDIFTRLLRKNSLINSEGRLRMVFSMTNNRCDYFTLILKEYIHIQHKMIIEIYSRMNLQQRWGSLNRQNK